MQNKTLQEKPLCSNSFHTVLIKNGPDFLRKKLVSNPKFTDHIRLFKVGNKTMGRLNI